MGKEETCFEQQSASGQGEPSPSPPCRGAGEGQDQALLLLSGGKGSSTALLIPSAPGCSWDVRETIQLRTQRSFLTIS